MSQAEIIYTILISTITSTLFILDLTKLIANAHNAKEFKDGIIVIQSVFLQFFGMLIYHCQSQCRYAFAFHCKDGQSDIKKGK